VPQKHRAETGTIRAALSVYRFQMLSLLSIFVTVNLLFLCIYLNVQTNKCIFFLSFIRINEGPNITTNCTQKLTGESNCCRKKTLSDLALPLSVVDELLKTIETSNHHQQ
jgi:hypothetical protein